MRGSYNSHRTQGWTPTCEITRSWTLLFLRKFAPEKLWTIAESMLRPEITKIPVPESHEFV